MASPFGIAAFPLWLRRLGTIVVQPSGIELSGNLLSPKSAVIPPKHDACKQEVSLTVDGSAGGMEYMSN